MYFCELCNKTFFFFFYSSISFINVILLYTWNARQWEGARYGGIAFAVVRRTAAGEFIWQICCVSSVRRPAENIWLLLNLWCFANIRLFCGMSRLCGNNKKVDCQWRNDNATYWYCFKEFIIEVIRLTLYYLDSFWD